MGIVIDLIIIAIILLSTLIGYKKGLINVIFNLCAFLVALVITLVLYKPVTNWVIENTEFDNQIENIIIENGVTDNTDNVEINEYLDKYVSKTIKDTKNDIVKSTSTIIAEKIVQIFVVMGLLIITRILLSITKGLANGIASLPIIKQCNELGGLVYGILRGFVLVYIVLAIFFLVISVNNTGNIANTINSSFIAKMLYENNILLKIIF
ncbi:MAG: CvpA family protein [Clostridia bacterium]|nr:CvpA family protein [Clostridia bacterium]